MPEAAPLLYSAAQTRALDAPLGEVAEDGAPQHPVDARVGFVREGLATLSSVDCRRSATIELPLVAFSVIFLLASTAAFVALATCLARLVSGIQGLLLHVSPQKKKPLQRIPILCKILYCSSKKNELGKTVKL